MIGRKRLFGGVAPLAVHSVVFAGGLLLANIAALAPARADACTAGGVIDAADGTTCSGGSTDGNLTYPDSNGNYQDGDFTLTLDGHDVTDGGIFFGGTVNGDGFIVLENGSDVFNTGGDGINASADAPGEDLTINVGGSFVTGLPGRGIGAQSTSGAITITTGEDSRVTSGNNRGIEAASETGAIEITTGSDSAINSAAEGIKANTESGAIEITMGVRSQVSVRSGGDGIEASTESGAIGVTMGLDSEIIGVDDGINASTESGAIEVETGTLSRVTGNGGDGIEASTEAGAVKVETGAVSKVRGDISGIVALSVTGNVTVTTGANSKAEGVNGSGVRAESDGTVVVTTGVDSLASSGSSNGIEAATKTGGVTVTTGGGSTTTSSGTAAILAHSRGAGAVKVETGAASKTEGATGILTLGNFGAAIITIITGTDSEVIGVSGEGISAQNSIGAIEVSTGAGSKLKSNGGDGIGASSDSGAVAVTMGAGSRAEGINGNGIDARSVAGAVTVTMGAGSQVMSDNGTAGIDARSINSGVTVGMNAGSSVISQDGDGIHALAGGAIGITMGADSFVNSFGGDGINVKASGVVTVVMGTESDITSSSGDGIDVTGGATTVETGAGSSVNGNGGDGIHVLALFSDATVTMGGRVSGDGSGINAQSTTGAVRVTTGANSKATGANGNGINAASAGTVTVETGANSTATGGQLNGDGILAANTASGDVFVDAGANSTITGGDDGIDAQGGTGNVSVIAREGTKVTGGSCDPVNGCLGDGIEATTLGAGAITIDNQGVTLGANRAITATTGTGTIQIGNTGAIANLSLNAADVAIHTEGGAATINNGGLIRGRVETGNGGDVLNNSLTWVTRGFSDFGEGIDTVTNNGLILAAVDAGSGGFTNFTGLETLNNNGSIVLVDQFSRDGSNFSDRLVTDHDYAGNGSALLAIDASLGGEDSNSDSLVVGGNTSGVTRIVVNNTSLGGGALNTEGILVVNVVGTAGADDFVLADGPIDAGFFVYDLVFNNTDQDNDQFLLVSEADGEIFETLATVAASQEIWRETADTWAARQQAMRDRVNAGVMVTAVADPALPGSIVPENGLWFSALGSWTARDSRISGFDLDYDQSIYGFVAGADIGIDLGDDRTLLFGVLAGYVDSTLDFDASLTSIKTDGATLGVYAGLIDGGFFANVLIQADLLNQTFSAPSLPSDTSDDADVVSIGARADIGYRFDTGALFIEPMISLDAVSTSIDEFSVGGADIDAGTNESFRAGAGLRAGITGERATASLTGRVWNVFATDNEVVFTAEDTVLNLSDDDLEGVYGEVSGQFDVDLSSGTLLFVKGGVLFSDDITKPSVTGGLNFTW